MTVRRFKYTYDRDLDRVHWSILVFPAMILGALIHPGLNSSYVSDVNNEFRDFELKLK